MNVRATVERLGREHVGKSWWVDLAEALVQEFEPVVAERDGLRERREAADRVHADTMRGWAETAAERDRYKAALEKIADPRCGIFTASDGHPGIDTGAESRIARAALDRGTP